MCERIYETARRVVTQVGLTSVPFNIEFFWDEQHDRLNLLEINPRHSQSHAGLFQAVDGAANHQILVELALGREPRMPHREGEHAVAGKYFLRRFVDGTALRVPTSSEVAAIEQELPGTRIGLRVGEGTRLSELPDQDSYSYELAHIYIGARDEQEMRRKYDRCADALRFEFDDAGGSA